MGDRKNPIYLESLYWIDFPPDACCGSYNGWSSRLQALVSALVR